MGLLASRQQKLIDPIYANVDLINTVVKPINTVVDPVNAVVDPLNVRLNFGPELLNVRPLQRTHGQNNCHHHARGQPLPPLVHDAAKARRGFCLVCRPGCG